MTKLDSRKQPTMPVSRYHLVQAGLLAVIVASLMNALVRFIALELFNVPDLWALGWGPVLIATAGAAVVASVIYGILIRFSKQPNRTFTTISAIVLLISFGPMLLSPPPLIGAPWSVFATLAIMHVVAAVTIVGVLTRASKWRQPEGQ